jgi:hypothetical protein
VIKYTIVYVIGPAIVTNIALLNLPSFALNTLAEIHTGMETMTQRTKNEITVITIGKYNDSFVRA